MAGVAGDRVSAGRQTSTIDLEQEAGEFAAYLQTLLDGVLPGKRVVRVQELGGRYTIGTDPEPIPLTVKGRKLATLRLLMACCADSSGRYLAVAESQYLLLSVLTRAPLLRFHYRRDARTTPSAHWHLDGERGAMSHLLAHAGAKRPHRLDSLHLPVGGDRYRPCLEDFLQFLIDECGIDAASGWRRVVEDGRERWRRLQIRTLVRDAPADVAEALERLGYTVTPPAVVPRTNVESLRRW